MVGVITLLGLDVGANAQKLLGAGLVLLAIVGYATSALLLKRPTIAALPSLGVVSAECTIAAITLTYSTDATPQPHTQPGGDRQLARPRPYLHRAGLLDVLRTRGRSRCESRHRLHLCQSCHLRPARRHRAW
jgi:hypothetical protein